MVGAKYTNLPPLKKIPIVHYQHHLTVINIYLILRKSYPEVTWMSERYLIRNNSRQRNKKKHFADGELIFATNKRIAIEVELSLKGKKRVDDILKSYATQSDIEEVWYYCPNNILPFIQPIAAKWSFVRVNSLEDFYYAGK